VSYDSEAFDTAETYASTLTLVHASYGIPRTPEQAMPIALLALAATDPLTKAAQEEATVEWMTPAAVDALGRAAAALEELRDELESVLDDVGVIEPGTPMEPVTGGPPRGAI
jgi:hypothetical protein